MKKTAKGAAPAKRKRAPGVSDVGHKQIRRLTKDRTEPIPILIALPKPSESEIIRVEAKVRRRRPANHG